MILYDQGHFQRVSLLLSKRFLKLYSEKPQQNHLCHHQTMLTVLTDGHVAWSVSLAPLNEIFVKDKATVALQHHLMTILNDFAALFYLTDSSSGAQYPQMKQLNYSNWIGQIQKLEIKMIDIPSSQDQNRSGLLSVMWSRAGEFICETESQEKKVLIWLAKFSETRLQALQTKILRCIFNVKFSILFCLHISRLWGSLKGKHCCLLSLHSSFLALHS